MRRGIRHERHPSKTVHQRGSFRNARGKRCSQPKECRRRMRNLLYCLNKTRNISTISSVSTSLPNFPGHSAIPRARSKKLSWAPAPPLSPRLPPSSAMGKDRVTLPPPAPPLPARRRPLPLLLGTTIHSRPSGYRIRTTSARCRPSTLGGTQERPPPPPRLSANIIMTRRAQPTAVLKSNAVDCKKTSVERHTQKRFLPKRRRTTSKVTPNQIGLKVIFSVSVSCNLSLVFSGFSVILGFICVRFASVVCGFGTLGELGSFFF
jgi:hypothetical protein